MGKFIVIEGMDGSGKSTQVKKLTEYLNKQGLRVKSFHFPSGKGFYGEIVNAFLRGEYGKAEEVDPYFVAFAFAGDRREMITCLEAWLQEYDVVLLDRYTFSNVAFQCAKIEDIEEQNKLRRWILDLEFNVFDIPKPELSIFLGVPNSFVRYQLSKTRKGEERKYLEGSSDIHEKDMGLQVRVGEQYRILCKEIEDMIMVDCTDEEGHMLHSDEIHRIIVELLKKE